MPPGPEMRTPPVQWYFTFGALFQAAGELGRRQDRIPVSQSKQIAVSAHKAIRVRGKQRGKNRIVPGVAGHSGIFIFDIDNFGLEPEEEKKTGDLIPAPPETPPDLRIRKDAPDLVEQGLRHRQYELGAPPGSNDPSRRTVREHEPRYQHVCVQNDLHDRRAAFTASSISFVAVSGSMPS